MIIVESGLNLLLDVGTQNIPAKINYTSTILVNSMSDNQAYYHGLIAQGYSEHKAEGYTKSHSPNSSKNQNMNGVISDGQASKNDNPTKHSNQFLLSLLLSITSIILVTFAMFSTSWMAGVESDDHYGINFGLTGFHMYEVGVDDDSETGSYSDLDEFAQVRESSGGTKAYFAGITALIFLILGLTAVIISLSLFVLDSLGIYNSKYLRLARFSSGGFVLVGIISWLILFPTSVMEEFSEINLDLGIAFYLALLGGIAGSLSGLMQISHRSVSNSGEKDGSIISVSNAISRIKSLSLQSINSTTAALCVVLLSIVLIFISMFSNSWMTDSIEDQDARFGLQEESWEYGGDTYVMDYSFQDCQESEPCAELGVAGLTAFVMLSISIILLVTAMVLIHLNSIEEFKSNYGKIAAICGGILSILATVAFYIMFPDLSKFDITPSPGVSILLVVLGGIAAIAGGVLDKNSQDH